IRPKTDNVVRFHDSPRAGLRGDRVRAPRVAPTPVGFLEIRGRDGNAMAWGWQTGLIPNRMIAEEL
ncbi:MAG: hypothetical protein ACE5NC_07770, partial [Anaerolineae bacterium]